MGALVYPGKGSGRCLGGVIPPFPPPSYPAVMPVYPPPPMYPSDLPLAAMQQHPQVVKETWRALGAKGEELRRVWERIREEERRLQEREARVMGEAAGTTGVQARPQGTPQGGEAQAVQELQHARADIRRRLEPVVRAELDGE